MTTNAQPLAFRPFSIVDTHVHLTHPAPVDDSVRLFRDQMEYYGYERIVLLPLVNYGTDSYDCDPSENAKAIYIKSVMNEAPVKGRAVYAYGTLHHWYDERDTAEGYLQQAMELYAMGVDGFKLLDGKPAMRKRLGRPLDDPIFDLFYRFAEDNRLPVTVHVGDPEEFWDLERIPKGAIERGWYCDETFPTLEQLRREVDGLLTKFPTLRLTLPHFFFLSNELERCAALLDRFPCLSLDITPGTEMYAGFSKRPADWRSFFVRYRERLIYGTDSENSPVPADLPANEAERPFKLVRGMLETGSDFRYGRCYGDLGVLHPLALDDETLRCIYHDNALRLLGEPREIIEAATVSYVYDLLARMGDGTLTSGSPAHDALELDNLRRIYTYFTSLDMVSN